MGGGGWAQRGSTGGPSGRRWGASAQLCCSSPRLRCLCTCILGEQGRRGVDRSACQRGVWPLPRLGGSLSQTPSLSLGRQPPPPSSPGGGAHLAHQLLGPSVLGASPSASVLFPAPPPRTPPAPVLRPLCSWSYVSACPHPCLPRPSLPFQGLGLLHLAFAHCLVDAHGPSESLRCGSASAPMVWGLCPPPRDPQGCPTEHHPPSSPVLALLTLFGLVVTRRGCRERTPLGI